jgi:hypothetical protein
LLVLIRIFQFSEVIFVLLSLLFYCRAPTPGGGVGAPDGTVIFYF